MEEWLHLVTKDVVVVIDAMALIVIVVGTVEAFFTGLWAAFPAPAHSRFRAILVRYGRWLVAGLTFQLAADIIETSIAPSWQDVGQLGAIAVIRTFLNFFLERDLVELSDRNPERPGTGPVGAGGEATGRQWSGSNERGDP
jgi:uncharacterized membrane protein